MKLQIPNNKTQIFGILGYPLHHTLSPFMHNYLLQSNKMNGIYLVFENNKPEKLDLLTLYRYGLRGLSVTIPHKEWAFQIADEKDESSEIMKAGNTLLFNQEKIKIYNTDGIGAIRAIENFQPKLLHPNHKGDILILGSGGSARGIAFTILKLWKEISTSKDLKVLSKNILISARNFEKGNQLVQELNTFYPNSTYFIPLEDIQNSCPTYVNLVINTTQVGMKGFDKGPLLKENSLHSKMVIFDIVYNPIETPFIKLAKKLKIPTIYGIEMLIYQGIEQFYLFTGIRPSKKQIQNVRAKMIQILKK